jgi:hypothetical protein
LAATESSIDMVLVQEDDELQEHTIYYLSHTFMGHELKYLHIENLALATFHATQQLQHYILLHKKIVVTTVNPFQYV